MSGYLLDTNHASRLVRRREPLRARLLVRPFDFHLCPIVLAEVRHGLTRKNLHKFLAEWERLSTRFAWLPIDWDDAARAADLQTAQERRGRQLELPDALIAAVALRHDLTLLTADRDFEGVPGLRIENWLAA